MIGATAAKLGLGFLLGLTFGWGHLWLLRRALAAALEATPTDAPRMAVRGLPIRMLLWTPVALVVGYTGLGACLGLLLGMTLSKWLCCRNMLRPR